MFGSRPRVTNSPVPSPKLPIVSAPRARRTGPNLSVPRVDEIESHAVIRLFVQVTGEIRSGRDEMGVLLGRERLEAGGLRALLLRAGGFVHADVYVRVRGYQADHRIQRLETDLDGHRGLEPGPLQAGQRALGQVEAGRAVHEPLAGQVGHGRVLPEHRQQRGQGGVQVLVPGPARVGRRQLDLGQQPLHHAVQQQVLVLEVPVEGHRGDAVVLGQPADRHGLDALGVGERQGGADDRVPAEPLVLRDHVDNYTPYMLA